MSLLSAFENTQEALAGFANEEIKNQHQHILFSFHIERPVLSKLSHFLLGKNWWVAQVQFVLIAV